MDFGQTPFLRERNKIHLKNLSKYCIMTLKECVSYGEDNYESGGL